MPFCRARQAPSNHISFKISICCQYPEKSLQDKYCDNSTMRILTVIYISRYLSTGHSNGMNGKRQKAKTSKRRNVENQNIGNRN